MATAKKESKTKSKPKDAKQKTKTAAKAKKRPTLEWESKFGYPRARLAGVDEVGRGCLAGPVVAGAVLLPAVVDYERDPWLSEVNDSKMLTPEARERLAPLIENWALSHAIGVASVKEIDRINIFHAAHLAMRRAIEQLKPVPERVIIDGKFSPKGLATPCSAVIKGDLLCLSVAAASILAKVWRDRHMAELDSRYPGYGLAVHKGYATQAHSQAIREIGICEIHRKSFTQPVGKNLSLF